MQKSDVRDKTLVLTVLHYHWQWRWMFQMQHAYSKWSRKLIMLFVSIWMTFDVICISWSDQSFTFSFSFNLSVYITYLESHYCTVFGGTYQSQLGLLYSSVRTLMGMVLYMSCVSSWPLHHRIQNILPSLASCSIHRGLDLIWKMILGNLSSIDLDKILFNSAL